MQVCLPPPSTLEIKEICLGRSGDTLNFLEELISVSPNLRALKNVEVSSLEALLRMGKSHLIEDLNFDPNFLHEMSTIQRFANILKVNILADGQTLKLKKIAIMFKSSWASEGMGLVVVNAVSMILSASKDSLKCLELSMIRSGGFRFNCFIPTLPQLENLSLVNHDSTSRFYFVGDAIGREIKTGQTISEGSDKQGASNIPVEYFPRLRKVSLDTMENGNNSDKLMGFFSLEQCGRDELTTIPGDTLSTVTSLYFSTYHHPQFYRKISNLFPNVSHLKMHCYSSCCLQNWLWSAFPKLERFEIVTLRRDWDTMLVDSFFTGISPELCAAFERESTSELTGPAKVLRRTLPYIGDCENLKEFKIKFVLGMKSKFASKMTAVLGLQDVVHRAKNIFEFETLSGGEIKETYQNLEPVAAFVEIRLK